MRRTGLLVLAAAIGTGAGIAGVSAFRADSGPRRRPLTPSVAAFRFPARKSAAAAPVVHPPTARFDEPQSAASAVAAFLSAVRDDNGATGYALLAAPDRDDYGSAAAWAASQSDWPRPTSFAVGAERRAADGVDVPVAVSRVASLDPFGGFVSARANQVWRAVQEDGRWRVRAEPLVEQPVVPPDAAAQAPAAAWVDALSKCDGAGAHRLQAGGELTGPVDLLDAPCREHGAWSVGAPVTLDRAPDVQPFLEAYGPDTATWARLVPVHGPRTHFFAALAPLGDEWRVIGVTPSVP